MKEYVKMLLFVFILGGVVSFLLLGMDYLTKDRIEQNTIALVRSSILDAYDIDYNFNNINDVFIANVRTYDISVETNGTTRIYTFYEDNATKNVSYIFEGDGVWGPIVALITLEPDFKTIVSLTILEQQETPGLGGVLAEKPYLRNFVGVVLSDQAPYIIIRHGETDSLPNEVDAITGGTRTSERFELMFNRTYGEFKAVWEGRS